MILVGHQIYYRIVKLFPWKSYKCIIINNYSDQHQQRSKLLHFIQLFNSQYDKTQYWNLHELSTAVGILTFPVVTTMVIMSRYIKMSSHASDSIVS